MKIVLIGAGNVGHHLGQILFKKGENIVQVFSRKKEKAIALSEKINASSTDSLSEITTRAELYILAVHDDALQSVIEELIKKGLENKLMVHTSGATPQTVFTSAGAKRYGVFYPLQTFSPHRIPDFKNIPICLDANSKDDFEFLNTLAKKISSNIYSVDDGQRAILHVAAVFANNFSNHLFHIASDILSKNNLPFEILLPLIGETVEKIKINPPKEMQTGPAIRGDKETMRGHLEFLKQYPEYFEVYSMLSKKIENQNEQS